MSESHSHLKKTRGLLGVVLWAVGLSAVVYLGWRLRDSTVNVVNYDVVDVAAPALALTAVVPLVVLLCLITIALARRPASGRTGDLNVDDVGSGRKPASSGLPLVLAVAVAAWWLGGLEPGFVTLSVAVVGLAWAIDRAGRGVSLWVPTAKLDMLAPVLLAGAILVSTIWHTIGQIDFWQHFLLGYADFGFFTTELEHCLPWKDVGDVRFSDTRMGYHCVPMFYLLVPLYAVFRSPVFLMVVGPLVLNLAAIPFYQLAKQRSGSVIVALVAGLAWLALPSISRLPYTNTYSFQSIFLAVPFLAWTFCLGVQGRWRASHVCLALALLCEETVCGVALGWGVYLFLWGGRRRDGVWIAVISVAYLFLCTGVIIPFFQGAGEYTRLMLFGDLTPSAIIERFTRPRALFYLIALAAPLLIGLLRSWRLLVVLLPTLVLVMLMHQTDYLNIKYWHQTSMLPVLFVAAVVGVTGESPWKKRAEPTARGASVGAPLGLLVGVLVFHFFMGSSPLAQSQRVYAANEMLRKPDPRLPVLAWARQHFSPAKTTIVATERMAAHFTDYRMVHPAPRARLGEMTRTPCVLIIDRSDGWDNIVMEHKIDQTVAQAQEAGFALVHEYGPVLVFANEAAWQASGLGRPQ